MNPEQRQVLEMLAAGRISADEAERLMDRVGGAGGTGESGGPGGPGGHGGHGGHGGSGGSGDPGGSDLSGGRRESDTAGASGASGASGAAPPKYLRVVVDSLGGDKVNVRVPMELLRAGLKLGSMLPNHAREHLDSKGIDLSRLSGLEGERLVSALRDLTVDVNAADGEVVRIFCE